MCIQSKKLLVFIILLNNLTVKPLVLENDCNETNIANGITENTKSELDITIGTTDVLAEYYYQTHNDINTVKNHLDNTIKLINENFKNDTEKIIIDVGCGPGRDVKYFTDNNIKAVGIDLSKSTLDIAKLKVPNAQFFLMDMTKIKFPNLCFHGIWSCGSFYHIPKKMAARALKEFNRILKKRGILFLAIKEGEGEKIISKEEYNKLPKFYSFYKVNEITKLLEKYGFEVIKINFEKKYDNWINIYALKIGDICEN